MLGMVSGIMADDVPAVCVHRMVSGILLMIFLLCEERHLIIADDETAVCEGGIWYYS